jgi:DNA-binding ferritin-like protein (Dps family)
MNLWERATGSDISREWKSFDARAQLLPPDYQAAWEEVKVHLAPHSDLTGRNLLPILDGVLGLLEETAADGQSVQEVLGDDISGFCAALVGGSGRRDYRDRWREQLNRNVATKLGRLGG